MGRGRTSSQLSDAAVPGRFNIEIGIKVSPDPKRCERLSGTLDAP